MTLSTSLIKRVVLIGLTCLAAVFSVALRASFADEVTPVAPGAPTGLAVTAFTGTTVTLGWTAPESDGGSAITDYRIRYRLAQASEWQTFTDGVSTATTTTVTGLTKGETYRFDVAAINSVGPSLSLAAGGIDVGATHSCALLSDGTVRCWGGGSVGQLGDGLGATSTTPVTVYGITTATAISVGGLHACALLSDGTVQCWGFNNRSQLGDGTQNTALAPVTISTESAAIAISAGDQHTCAVLTDHTVWCWGYNEHGELGDGSTADSATPHQVTGLTGAIAVTAGVYHTCALTSTGTVWCWGFAQYGALGDGTDLGSVSTSTTPVQVTGMTTATAVAVGDYHSCAILADETVKCWGYNGSGELGNGTNDMTSTPVAVPGLTGVTSLSAGPRLTCATVSDGPMSCWGKNDAGQLGDGTTTDANEPVTLAGDFAAAYVNVSGDHSCVLDEDGGAQCWGNNDDGELGDGTVGSVSAPVHVAALGLPSVEQLAAQVPAAPGSPTVSIDSSTTLSVSWTAPTDNGGQDVSGYTVQYQEGDGSWTPEAGMDVTGTSTTLAGLTTGSTYKVRVAAVNTIGTGAFATTATGTELVTVPAPPANVHVASFDATSVSLAWDASPDEGGRPVTDYSIRYRLTGIESWTTLVDGVSTDRTATVTGLTRGSNYQFQVRAETEIGTSPVLAPVALSMGDESACVVMSDKSVRCWGANWFGQLTGTERSYSTPITVPNLSNVTSVGVSEDHACALLEDHTVKCWGDNGYGQLGQGDSVSHTGPIAVPGLSDVVELGVGGWHTCALLSSGTVKCWGANWDGELGQGDRARRTTPVTVPGVSDVVHLAVGSIHSCALLRDHSVTCWGSNYYGAVGDNSGYTAAAVTDLTGVSSLALGDSLTCALMTDHTVKCLGYNRYGQVGDGTTTNTYVPQQVIGLSGVVSISAGGYSACALLDSGVSKCWGRNSDGQLGDGTATHRSTPVTVTALPGMQVNPHYDHACVLNAGIEVQCWGYNGWNQLGDGTQDSRKTAAPVGNLGSVVQIPSVLPAVPTSVATAIASRAALDVTWAEPADDGGQSVHQYRVQYSTNGGESWLPVNPTLVSGTSYRLPGLSLGTSYLVRVSARNAVGWGPWATASTLLLGSIPDQPLEFRATAITGTTVTLEWSPPGANGGRAITDYAIRYRPDSGGAWTTFADGISTGTSATITGLTKGLSYTFQVAAVNGEGTPHWDDLSVTSVDVGYGDTCTLMTDSTVRCWGYNGSGQLGNASYAGSVEPVQVTGLTAVTQIAHGSDAVCALIADGTIDCWGNNSYGQLGYGGEYDSGLPVSVQGISSAVSVSMSVGHACAVLEDGTAKCWGANSNGELGDGTRVNRRIPVPVPGLEGIVDLSVGYYQSCAVLDDGTVRCWGWNGDGSLGDGTTDETLTPVTVAGITTAKSVSVGNTYTCAVLDDSTVKCWGVNDSGQLGIGSRDFQIAPQTVTGLSNVVSVSAGTNRTCAVLTDGTVTCWGAGSPGNSLVPVALDGLSAVSFVAVGDGHTCARLAQGTIECWGANYEGELGDGTTAYRALPVSAYLVGSATVHQMPAVAPGAVSAPQLTATTRTTLSVALEAPSDNGGMAPTSFDVQYSADGGSTWLPESPMVGTESSLDITGLTPGETYVIRVAATNLAGTGPWTSSLPTLMYMTPRTVPSFAAVRGDTVTHMALSWTSVTDDGGTSVLGYRVQQRVLPNGAWVSVNGTEELGADARSVVATVATGTRYAFRVAGRNAAGVGVWTSVEASSLGTSAMTLHVVDSDGESVTGGSYTWELGDSSAGSGSPVVADASGHVVFASVVVGNGTVTVQDAVTASGLVVSGTWSTAIGGGSQTLTLPEAAAPVHREVHVALSSGIDVAGATVVATGLSDTEDVGDFTFTVAESRLRVVTDEGGLARIYGILEAEQPTVHAEYRDSALRIHTPESDLSADSTTELSLGYLPSVTTSDPEVTVVGGRGVDVTFTTLNASGDPLSGQTVTASEVAPLGAVSMPRLAVPGCTAILSAVTDNTGAATLHLCPSRSASYTISSPGAVGTRTVSVTVTPVVPLAPASVKGTPRAGGRALIAWQAPVFDGGSAIEYYKIVLTTSGQKISIKTSGIKKRIGVLKRHKTYKVTVAACNAAGCSPTKSARFTTN